MLSQDTVNPRQQVLENFREISRIMTQSYLAHKKIERRFGGKAGMPTSETDKLKMENSATQRMTNILKQMHSPKHFAAPAQFGVSSTEDYSLMHGSVNKQKERHSLAEIILDEPISSRKFMKERSVTQPAANKDL